MTKRRPKTFPVERKELSKLRALRTKGFCTPYGRIEELERLIATNGASHGLANPFMGVGRK
jgi:hypothetical protein